MCGGIGWPWGCIALGPVRVPIVKGWVRDLEGGSNFQWPVEGICILGALVEGRAAYGTAFYGQGL